MDSRDAMERQMAALGKLISEVDVSKWTPGPWELAPGSYCMVRTDDAWIASTVNCDNRAANARLIAAAPDLAAALERILGCVARTASGDVCQTYDFDDARAALAKAKGETP